MTRPFIASIRHHVLVVLLFCMINPAMAGRSMDQNTRLWTRLKTESAFKDSRWRYSTELQVRFGDDKRNFDEALFRGGVAYTVDESLAIWLGYDMHALHDDDTGDFHYEQRLWQMLSWYVSPSPYFDFESDTKLEERKSNGDSGIAYRLRQRFGITLNNYSDFYAPVFSEEIYFNLNHPDWVGDDTVDQNRIFLGVDFKLSGGKALRVGYLNRIRFRSMENILDHILYLSLNL